jgi:methylglyoxal reductase
VPPDFTPIAETIGCLLKLRDTGKIRALGVCNVSPGELEENLCASANCVVSNQFRYSLLHRDPEQQLLPLCAQRKLATLTYMSLEQGLLTGKVGMDRVFGPEEFRSNQAWSPWFVPANRRRALDLLASWQPLTDKYRCTLSQLVLAWTAAQPGVTHVLVGGRTQAQATENAKAGNLRMTPNDIGQMRRDVEALGEPQFRQAEPTK